MVGRLGLMAMIAGILVMQVPLSAAALPKPTYTNRTKFRIPYKFDPVALKRMNASEVQLHVSRDHGVNWQLAQSREPNGQKFEYQCEGEGEYWFAVKTLDDRMQLHPPRGSYETGLIVVVDNTSPTLDLSLLQLADDRVQLTWKAADPNLDPATLRLEFLAAGARDWEGIRTDSQVAGKSNWIVPPGLVKVRGTVSDYADNVANERVEIDIGSQANRAPKGRPSLKGPIAESDASFDSNSFDQKNSITKNSIPDDAAQDREYRGPVITPRGSIPVYGNSYDQLSSAPNASAITLRNENSGDFINAKTGSDQIPVTSASMGTNSEISLQPQFASRSSTPNDPSNAPSRDNGRDTSRLRLVQSRHFQIGYAIDDVGPSGISLVELFITEDHGKRWWKYGDDPDLKSPFDVKVRQDGEYGFSVRARSGAGLSSNPPVPGEKPQFIILVDQTPPVVELLPVQQGQGPNINRLRIRWRQGDDHPSDKPVSLYYSPSRSGPWERIMDWKEDRNGTFDWTVGTGVPAQFYIRVMVRDAVGNIGKAETPQPIIVDLSRPTAQIIDIEALENSGPQ